MNILLFGTNNYIKQIKTTIYSILKNNRTKINFYLFMELDSKNKNSLIKLFTKNKCNYYFLNGFPENFKNHLNIKDHTQIFLNKFIFFCLPDNLERILYLDCDIVVNKNLINFYNLDFEDKSLIVTKDLVLEYGPRLMPNNVANPNYFNAGVLLINLKKIKKVCSLYLISDYLNKYRGNLPCDDQDILNMIFINDIKVMQNRNYNFCIRHKDQSKHNEIKEASIIHYYYQNNKPWKYSYYNRNGFRYYWKYAKKYFGFFCYLGHKVVYLLKVFRYYYLGLLHGKLKKLTHK